jgi:prophage regulatory protein
MPLKQHSINHPIKGTQDDSAPELARSVWRIPDLQNPLMLLRRPQVLSKLGIARATLYQWLDPKSPQYVPDMPRPIKLSERSRCCYWLEEEVDLFIQRRVTQVRQSQGKGAQ